MKISFARLLVKNTNNGGVTKGLYSTNGGATVAQQQDYRYNIRGWLQRMNNSDVSSSNNTSENIASTQNDLFGFELAYNSPFANGTGNTVQYNGNISAMKWSSNMALGAVKEAAYNYSYDALNRLTAASYLTNPTGTWSNTSNSFSESGYTYDLNGNIKALTRNGSTGTAMDNMTYTYSGNQLLAVSDAGDAAKGFTDGNTSGNDYAYDVMGNIVTDKNKSLTATNAILYNHLNLPTQVTKSTNEKIVYTYDAGGRKLTQQVYDGSGNITKTTDYDGEFIYQNDVLQFINHEEGRTVMTGASPEYQYHLKDHLGNVRLTFTTKTASVTSYVAHFENPTAETGSFNNYQTTSAFIVTDNTKATSPSNSYHLNGGYGQQVGITKTLSVMPGDQVSISANAKYTAPTTTASNIGTNIVSALLTAFSVSTGTDAGNGLTSYGNWDNGTTIISMLGTGDEQRSDAIKAFVTIIIFDRNYNLLDVTYQSVQSNGTLAANYTVKQPGYAYLYISNEHPYLMDVYFDDVTVSLTPSPVVQQEDFYPFGLTFNSYSREKTVPQNYLYNGKEQINDLNLDWADYGVRMYMPEIGRWGVVDPFSDLAGQTDKSAYQYAWNNPTTLNDPSGKCPCLAIPLIYEAFVAAGLITAGGTFVVLNKDEFFPPDYSQMKAMTGVPSNVGGENFDPSGPPNFKPGSKVALATAIVGAIAAVAVDMKEYTDRVKQMIKELSHLTPAQIANAFEQKQLEEFAKHFLTPEQVWGILNQEAVLAAEEYKVLTNNGSNYFDLKRFTNKMTRDLSNQEKKGKAAKKLLSTPLSQLQQGTYVWNGEEWITDEQNQIQEEQKHE